MTHARLIVAYLLLFLFSFLLFSSRPLGVVLLSDNLSSLTGLKHTPLGLFILGHVPLAFVCSGGQTAILASRRTKFSSSMLRAKPTSLRRSRSSGCDSPKRFCSGHGSSGKLGMRPDHAFGLFKEQIGSSGLSELRSRRGRNDLEFR